MKGKDKKENYLVAEYSSAYLPSYVTVQHTLTEIIYFWSKQGKGISGGYQNYTPASFKQIPDLKVVSWILS